MDQQTQDFETNDSTTTDQPQPGLSRIFLKRLLKKLAATLPVDAQENPEEFAEEWEAARDLFFSFQPRTPFEAILAARIVALHLRGMDLLARASRPDIPDEKAQRLTASVIAAGRSVDAAERTLIKRQAPPSGSRPEGKQGAAAKPTPQRRPASAQPEQPAEPELVPEHEFFQPRDRHGKPIPDWRYEWMTMAQRRAAYAYPRNPAYEAEALAEEEKMIAEQAAEGAARQAADPDPAPGTS